ncbi:tRNA1(Val) (adenine(37)-N6)-methyltransferase [Moritella sp. F3]|uniref:tRNA1(Val) (adenine(37)-N6)-methyltransferase n=1 Tax=Moritella sp. F3 TaxID=2718882 RepID=UPI001A24F873|nr:methyltransferase [Moritella sp. F3]GIC79637.1 tRNA1(Val) (adenine(37)-N6)-methyltransferase [Moritella sp. F1]GIC83138.1 tRNA1(Val) (adenine(37)-N6)-methyltransferase [Moritella sp. F3]
MINKSDGFSFKQFHVSHADCAMKVGTDGILLGGWADVNTVSPAPLKVLDIGTGSGLISLMLAQRCQGNLQAIAIDIDASACEQAKRNVDNSPWSSSIAVKHVALQALGQTDKAEPATFDLIVSNPPYFAHGQEFTDDARKTARHTGSLSHQELIDCALTLLAPNGCIALVLPYKSGCELATYCQQLGSLNLTCLNIKTTPKKPYKRMLMRIRRGQAMLENKSLTIHEPDGSYSKDYQDITKEFYLKM